MARTPLLLAAALLCCGVQPAWPQPDAPARPHVIVTEIDGIIQPISAEYFTDAIGLGDTARGMVSRMITSRAPVVVFVGPSGGRAASAGFILLLAADVAAMAPGTHSGAAHPVSGTSEK